MQAVAKAKYLRYSARKLRQVADLVRGKSAEHALTTLSLLSNQKKGAPLMQAVLKSAIANFQQQEGGNAVPTGKIKLAKVIVDEGPIIKRIQARAQGRAYRIEKNLCHITIELAD
jgi:large subunit ribosomal protein L22